MYTDCDGHNITQYTYDEADRLTKITYRSEIENDGATREITYADFDENGQPQTAYIKSREDGHDSVTTGAAKIYYDSMGRVKRIDQTITSDSGIGPNVEKAAVFTYRNGFIVNIAETHNTPGSDKDEDRFNARWQIEYLDDGTINGEYHVTRNFVTSNWDQTDYFFSPDDAGKWSPSGYRTYAEAPFNDEGASHRIMDAREYIY